ncbi:MAG: cytochrome c [Acidobacteriaceae bacterium]
MLKPFLMIPALFLVPVLFQQAPSTPPAQPAAQQAAPAAPAAIPAEWVNKANPVKATSESQARAKQIYSWDCAMCHGDNGNGKGDVATDQKLTIRDYRDPASLKTLTDGEMFYIIRNGKGQMPSEGPRAKDDEVWNLVIYLRKMSNTQGPTAVATQ